MNIITNAAGRIEIIDENGNAFITTRPDNYATAQAWIESWLEAYTANAKAEPVTQVEELEAELQNLQEYCDDLEKEPRS